MQASNDIEIPSNSLYPSLSSLQADYTLQNTENEALQFDLLRQFTHGDYDKYTAPSQEVEASNMQSIEDLLSMAEKDAEEANEAIQHIREEDQREQELDDALLEEIEHVLSDQEMQVEEDNDKLALQATDETEETETDVSPDLPSAKQKSASREASDVISIGSTSEEEEEEEGEEDEAEEEEEEGIDLEEELEEEDESDALEMTPPPVQSQTSQPEPSRQLFGQLDAPVASQARYMSQKARRRMDEDDLRMSGFDEEDGMVASGSSDASEEYEREWQQFRRKAGRGQRAQDEQDAADRYFDDEAEGEDDRVSQGSSQEEEDESEDEENEPEGFTPRFSSQQLKAAKEEFEDQLSDEAVADEERQSQLLEAGLDERVPIPAFMKRDKETGEYDLRIGSSDDDDEQDEDDEMEEEDENADTEAVLQDTETDDLKIEVLEDEQLEVQIEEAIEVSASTQSDAVGTDETIITTKVSSLNGLDPSLVAGSASDDIDSQSIEDHLDLAKSEQSVSPGTAAINISGQQIDVNQILEASLAEMQPLLPNFSALPPLPDSLAEVADQLLSDSLDAAKEDLSQTLEKSIDDAFSTNESKDSTMVTPSLAQNAEGSTASRARSKSREPNTSAVSGTPRKSESVLFSSMAVSPEQFTLPRRAVTPSHAVDKNVPDRDSIQHDVAATPLPTGLTDAANQTHVSESEMSAGSPAMQRVEKDTLRDSTAAIIVPEEPVPASVTPGDESETSPRENVPSSQALQAQDSHILREDHRHEPPPPELQEEERFEHASAPQPVEEAMFGIDLTTDEMESHSVDGSKEREPPIDSPFTEDHHFEPPPPELQEVSDNLGGEDVLSEKEPLAGIDMTTDEMEVHSGDERAAGPVHQIGYKEEHLFEPAPLPSEQPVKNKEVEEVLSPAPDSKHLREATDEKSESASSMGAQEEKTATPAESAGLANTPSAPGPTESTAIQDIATKSGQPQNVATPKRTFNVIKPGLWDPSTPIRFGGQSLEAAVREAYYDPDRSANLQKTLGSDQAQFEGNPSNDESLKADTSTRSASNKGHARFEVEEIQENTDFIPVVSESPALGEATEKTETVMDDTVNISEDSRPGDDVVPARVSSPGIKQPDGSLTEAVQEADFVSIL